MIKKKYVFGKCLLAICSQYTQYKIDCEKSHKLRALLSIKNITVERRERHLIFIAVQRCKFYDRIFTDTFPTRWIYNTRQIPLNDDVRGHTIYYSLAYLLTHGPSQLFIITYIDIYDRSPLRIILTGENLHRHNYCNVELKM